MPLNVVADVIETVFKAIGKIISFVGNHPWIAKLIAGMFLLGKVSGLLGGVVGLVGSIGGAFVKAIPMIVGFGESIVGAMGAGGSRRSVASLPRPHPSSESSPRSPRRCCYSCTISNYFGKPGVRGTPRATT